MMLDTAITANGSSDMCGDSSLAKYQAIPPSRSQSVMRSTVESKNAPRWLAVSDALASAPSSRSGNAARITRSRPRRNWPAPIATAAPTPTSRPRMVRWSGVSPVRRRAAPIGLTALSTGARNLPSNIEATLSRLEGGFGVVFRQTLDDPAVDRVDEHQPSSHRWILGGVAQHTPRRTAAHPPPHLLRRGVTHREPERLLCRHECVGFVDVHAPATGDGEHPDRCEHGGRDEPAAVDHRCVVEEDGHQHTDHGDHEIQRAGPPT